MVRKHFDEEFTSQSPWLDLVNSEQWDGFGRMSDHLLDDRWLKRFAAYWNLSVADLGKPPVHAQLAGLRSRLRQLVVRVSAGNQLRQRDIDWINSLLRAPEFLQLARRRRQLVREPVPVRIGWRWVKARIVASFVDACLDQPERIKICQNELCQWTFLDATRNNNRRWCHDRRCGNRARVRRSRERAAGNTA